MSEDSPPLGARAKRPKLSRDEKAKLTRENLLAAGALVVGTEGYASAAIARIADAAGVAHGTFYNYFADRQALFNELLPYEGLRMRAFIEAAVHDTAPGIAREIARFRGFLRFVAQNPGFYRVLYEAEIFAPEAHHRHVATIVEGYQRSLKRAQEAGLMIAIDAQETEALIYQLLGMRAYAAMQLMGARSPEARESVIEAAVALYGRLLSAGIFLKG